jgi:hypothetical protein
MEKTMKKLIAGAIAPALLLAASIGHGADKEQSLAQLSADYAKWRDYLRPSPSEQSHRKVAWRASVLQGVVDAHKQDKPLVILLMNGHPLGCT